MIPRQRPSERQPVGIFWDIENYAPPSNAPGHTLPHKIRTIAKRFGEIAVFKAYIDIQAWGNTPRVAELRSELQSSGVSVTDCPRQQPSRKEVADKMLLVDAMSFPLQYSPPAAIIIISGDRDFAYGISVLRRHRYYMVLITPKNRVHRTLLSQANVVFDWNELFGPASTGNLLQPSIGLVDEPGLTAMALLEGASFNSLADIEFPVDVMTPPSVAVATGSVARVPSSPGKKSSDISDSVPASPIEAREDVISSRTGVADIPSIFADLVEVLAQIRYMGVDFPRRRTVKDMLLQRDPDLLERNQLSRFTDLVNWAEREEVVVLGRGFPRWISLHRHIQLDLPGPSATWPELPSERLLPPTSSNPIIPHPIGSSPTISAAIAADYDLSGREEKAVSLQITPNDHQEAQEEPTPVFSFESTHLPAKLAPDSASRAILALRREGPDPPHREVSPTVFSAVDAVTLSPTPTHVKTPPSMPREPSGALSRIVVPALDEARPSVPAQFVDLVRVLESKGRSPATWVSVASRMHTRNPRAWVTGRPGEFKRYIERAASANIITMGPPFDIHGKGSISLHEQYRR